MFVKSPQKNSGYDADHIPPTDCITKAFNDSNGPSHLAAVLNNFSVNERIAALTPTDVHRRILTTANCTVESMQGFNNTSYKG